MNRILLLLLMALTAAHGYAQNRNSGEVEKVPVYNYSADGPMDAFSHLGDDSRAYVYVPEFYSRLPVEINDTTYSYEEYDSRDSIIKTSTLTEPKDIRFVSVFKNYPDRSHPFIDAKDGIKKPLPVSSIVRRYDRVGPNKWMCIDYASNKYTELEEHPTYIVRTDTLTLVDPVTNKESSIIFCYYKVEQDK